MMMRKALFLFLFTAFSAPCFSQIKAVTESGEEVLLFADGTWKDASYKLGHETRLDTLSYKKSPDATFMIKGKKVNYGLWINPKKWKFSSNTDEGKALEYTLTIKKGDAYAMVIPERVELSYPLLKQAAESNIDDVATSKQLLREEVRRINGNIMHMLEWNVVIKGLNLYYMGYYYTSEKGTIQVVGYTTENLKATYKTEIEELINGFEML